RRHRAAPRLRRCEPRDLPSASLPLSLTSWNEVGPAPVVSGQTPGGLPISGRASSVAVHPTNPDIIYLGTAGGGVWKTTNATAANPTWTPLTDTQVTSFIGAVALA